MTDSPEGGDSHDRHEPYAWHEPMPEQHHEHEHTQSHAGNGTVNHGPDDKGPDGLEEGPEGLRSGLGAGFGAGADGPEPLDGLDTDELALRRLLHSAVDDLAPRDGSLDHLRRAVPARRARKRQAAVGMAAAALFIGTAIPALVHVSNSGGTDPNTSMAGQASEAQGGSTGGKNPDGGAGTAGGSGGQAVDQSPGGAKDGGKSESTGAASGTKVVPTASAASSAPVCTSAQLATPTSTVGAPDSTGAVYGTFRVVNVSTTSCTVGGPGSVGVLAQGAADATKVLTARHTSGDAAAGLPDPTTELTGLVLAPGAAYEEKFGFVPSETCPTSGSSTGGSTGTGSTGSTGGSTPSPSPSEGASSSAGTTTSGSDGTTTQLLTEDGGTADGSVAVSYTPQAGSPTGSATVTNACAGTVYWTGVLAAQ
ncbi:hypothetical protein [Streptomyces sp. NPDC001833]|uniref:hypothetical protein n=1 Tax=Streptomyces sp. NPDC001833 TaxID=3154658 RepID=UPI0033187916